MEQSKQMQEDFDKYCCQKYITELLGEIMEEVRNKKDNHILEGINDGLNMAISIIKSKLPKEDNTK